MQRWSREERHALYEKCFDRWGYNAQVDMLLEELGELIVATLKLTRRDGSLENFRHMAEETADVLLMIEEITYFFDKYGHPESTKDFGTLVCEIMEQKLDRTQGRVEVSEN